MACVNRADPYKPRFAQMDKATKRCAAGHKEEAVPIECITKIVYEMSAGGDDRAAHDSNNLFLGEGAAADARNDCFNMDAEMIRFFENVEGGGYDSGVDKFYESADDQPGDALRAFED